MTEETEDKNIYEYVYERERENIKLANDFVRLLEMALENADRVEKDKHIEELHRIWRCVAVAVIVAVIIIVLNLI